MHKLDRCKLDPTIPYKYVYKNPAIPFPLREREREQLKIKKNNLFPDRQNSNYSLNRKGRRSLKRILESCQRPSFVARATVLDR